MRFGAHVFPNVELGPVRQGEDAHRLAVAKAGVEQPPQLGALVARIPGVGGRAMREDAFLGPALLLVAPRAAKGCVEAALVERLPQGLGLHHVGVHLRAGCNRRYAPPNAVLVDVDDEVEAEPARRGVAKGDHLAKLPGRVDMQQGERRLGRMEGLHRHVKHHARVFADRIQHNRIAHLCDNLAHYVN